MVEIAGFVLAICFLVSAAYWYYWYSPAPVVPPLGARIQERTIRVGNKDRSYRAYIPAHLPLQAELVIVLHGSGMHGARMRMCTGYEFDCLADQHGFVVLYPNGYLRNWNDCRKDATFPAKRENIDYLSFVRALIARLCEEQAINDKRVYVFGYSNGGHMAFRLAIEAPADIAAVAAVAASLPTRDSSSCPQEGRTSRVMVVNGTSDPIKNCHDIWLCEQRLRDVICGIGSEFRGAEWHHNAAHFEPATDGRLERDHFGRNSDLGSK
jgi:polyhydroxybutyrate depolymerase